MSQTPLSQPAIPPPPDRSPPAPQRRRTGPIAISIGVVIALLIGATALALTQRGSAEAEPLALSFLEGQEQTYEIHQTMDGQISSELIGDQPFAMDLTQVVTWKVLSVDEEGLATIEVTVSEMSGSMNGAEIPSTPIPPVEIVIAPDGRVVSTGGFDLGALGGAGQTKGSGFPGMGQLTPILPDEGNEVAPGDSWEKEFSQELPFGSGAIEYTASSTYDRNETVNGRESAVIVTDFTVPFDLSIEFADVIDQLGNELSGLTGSGGVDELGDASISMTGRGTFTQTSFVDLVAEELLRSQTSGEFELSMSLDGIPELGATGAVEMDFSGTFTQDLELR
jgi:hypothetical protein